LRIASEADGFRAAEAMLGKGARHALVKLGAKGYVLAAPGQQKYIPAPRVRVVDTNGAGDAFAGALAFALWEGQDVTNAFRFAVAASSLAVETYGSQPAYPDRERLENKLTELDN
jgi:ribokinase